MAGERKLNVVVSANIERLRTELKNSEAIINTTSKAMQRMGDAYDGTKTIGNANAAMLAVEKLGGITKLTEADQRKLHNTLSEGVAKYQALGQTAPASMLAMRDATAKVDTATTSLVGNLRGLAGTLGIAFGGAAVISGIRSLIGNTLEYAETIKDTSAKMGVSMEATQRWKFAAEQTGASLENVSKSVLKLSQGIDGDDKSLRAALAAAGVEMDTLKGKKPEEAFNIVAAAIAKIPDPMTQARVTLEAFGKSGTELLPALREGFIDVGNAASVMSDKTINALDRAKDAWDQLGNKVTVATGGIVGKILGMVERIAPAMQLMLAVSGQFDAAEMWGAFAKGADESAAAVDRLTASQKKYVDELIKVHGKAAVMDMSPAIRAYVQSLDEVPPKLDRVTTSTERAATATSRFKMSLPTPGDFKGATSFFDQFEARNEIFVGSLPGVTAGYYDFVNSIRIGNDEIEASMMTLPGVAANGIGGFMAELEVRNDDIRSVGSKVGDSLKEGFSESMKGLGNIIVGALQGGGDVGKAAGAYIGLSIGNSMAKNMEDSLNKALGETMGGLVGGLLGPVGSLLGGWIGGLFGGNDTKKDREQAAKMLGFSSLAGLNDALRGMGEEGQRLVNQGLNVIGKKDTAMNQRWIQDVMALFEKQKSAAASAATAVENASLREEAAINKVTSALQNKLDALDSERESVFNSIKDELEAPEYDEFGNRIYGVIEAQGLARLAEIDRQKAELDVQMAEASAKVMDTARVTGDGIRTLLTEIFAEPFRITFDVPIIPGVTTPGSGSIGGGGTVGGYGSRSSFATININNPSVRNDDDIYRIAREVMRVMPGEFAQAGL